MSERLDLWLSGLNPRTAKVYGSYRRRFELAQLTPVEAVQKTKTDIQTYIGLANLSNKFLTKKEGTVTSQRARHLAIFALRRFLYDNGVMTLPPP